MGLKFDYETPSCRAAGDLRKFVCDVQLGAVPKGENPLTEFNVLLNKVTREAFKEGAAFAKKYPDIELDLNWRIE